MMDGWVSVMLLRSNDSAICACCNSIVCRKGKVRLWQAKRRSDSLRRGVTLPSVNADCRASVYVLMRNSLASGLMKTVVIRFARDQFGHELVQWEYVVRKHLHGWVCRIPHRFCDANVQCFLLHVADDSKEIKTG